MLLSLFWQTAIDNPDKFNNYLLLGYLVMGLILFCYLLYLFSRQRNAQKELEVLNQLLEEEN